MIRFEDEDSDPYTHIVIYDGDEPKSGKLAAFSLQEFESWMRSRSYPQTVKEAECLLGEYDALIKKQVSDYHQRILNEIKEKEAKSYSVRYHELKSRGYDDAKIHSELFPEEYDFMFDDHVDAKLRSQGGNPMSQDYIAKVNARRASGGFSPLETDGKSQPGETMQWCKSQAREE